MLSKVLLISNPTFAADKDFPKRVFPLGLGYIAAELLATGRYAVKCMDFQDPRVDEQAVVDELRAKAYGFVGIKAYAVDYLWARNLAALLRAKFGDSFRILVGGPLGTFSHEVMLGDGDVDFCVHGEAETSLVQLLDNPDSPDMVPGVSFIDSDRGIRTVPGGQVPDKDIDEIARPAYDLFDIELYTKHRAPFPRQASFASDKYRTMDIITGRGCPFACSFCGRLNQSHRKRSVDLVVEEMKFLIDTYGINLFTIEDELFLYKKEWIFEFCDKVAALNTSWRCQSRAKGMSSKILNAMKKAGCLRITFGVESGSDDILTRMNKKITVDNIKESIRLCHEAGIYPGSELIIGTPGESEQTVAETVSMFKDLRLPPRPMGFLQPYPGTPLFNEYLERPELGGDHRKVLLGLSAEDGSLYGFSHNISGLPDEKLASLKKSAESEMTANYRAHADQHGDTYAFFG